MAYSILILFGSMMILAPSMCYAAQGIISIEELNLECCTEHTCPTRAVSEGIPEVQQTVEIKGVRVDGIHLPEELQIGEGFHDVIMLSHDQAYPEWKRKMISSFPREEARRILRTSMTDLNMFILVRCSSLSSTEKAKCISEPGESVTCPIGDSVFLEQSDPKCDEDGTGPQSVVTITKTRAPTDEEKLASAMQAKAAYEEAIAKREALLAKIKGLEAERAVNNEIIRENDRFINNVGREVAHELFGNGRTVTSTAQSSKSQKADKKAAKEEKAKQDKIKKEQAKQEKAEKDRAKKEDKGKGKKRATVSTAAIVAGIGATALIGRSN